MRGASNNPQLVLMNNTNAVQYVKLFVPSPNALSSLNARTKYSWNLTGETFAGVTNVMILVRPVGSSLPFATLTVATAPNLAGVVAALNSLNIGSFYSLVIGGNSFILTSNDWFELGNILINTMAG